MFGHQDDNHDDKHGDDGHEGDENVIVPDQPADDGQEMNGSQEGQDHDQPAPADDSAGAPDVPATDPAPGTDTDDNDQGDTGDAGHDDSWQNPDGTSDDHPEQIADIIAPAGGGDHPQHPAVPMPLNARDLADDDSPKTPHELIDIKQKALSELTPLLSELDQTPEDKFRTLLMIIQSSDNQDMVKQAYAAAEDIKDEKLRAQALLDIVNEINYFTQHPAG